jgi:hypothetical protein
MPVIMVVVTVMMFNRLLMGVRNKVMCQQCSVGYKKQGYYKIPLHHCHKLTLFALQLQS